MPLRGGGSRVSNHVAHDVWHNESADSRRDENGDRAEEIDDEAREGEAVRRREKMAAYPQTPSTRKTKLTIAREWAMAETTASLSKWAGVTIPEEVG